MGTAFVSATCLLAASSSSNASAQVHDWTASGSTYLAHLGYSVDLAGDVDGDGAEDLLVGSPRSLGVQGRVGAVQILSGRTGATPRRIGGSRGIGQ